MTTQPQKRYDTVIIGARCAGASLAMLLAQRGQHVLAIDRSKYGTDTVSTHALMRAGVEQLTRWGVLNDLLAAGTPPIRNMAFHYGDTSIALPIKSAPASPFLLAPRRTVLDRVLVDHARSSGAEVRFGCRLEQLVRDRHDRVTGVVVNEGGRRFTIECDTVVGADGIGSTVAELAGAVTYKQGLHASACVLGYWPDVDVDGYQWAYDLGVSAGAIPTSGGTCVFVTIAPARLRAAGRDVERCFEDALSEASPSMAARFTRGLREGGLRRFAGVKGFMRQSTGAGWALVGDAGYFKDPLTAHGITDALRDATLLANALVTGRRSLAQYQTTRDELSHTMFEVTDQIASLAWNLEQLQQLHMQFSAAMSAEINYLSNLEDIAAQAA